MRVNFEAKFSRGFLLSEEALRKVEDIIDNRFGGQESYERSLKIRRYDNTEIEYSDSTEMIKIEDNSKPYRIDYISIFAKSCVSRVEINFERSEKTIVKVNFENRDDALLLAAELKEYLNSEVLIKRFAFLEGMFRHKLSIPIIFTVSFLPFIIGSSFMAPRALAKDANVDQKMDYLIALYQQKNGDFINLPFYVMLALIFIISILSSEKIYPAYTFYFGRQKNYYDSVMSLREKIIWVVAIGLLISLIVAWLYDFLPFR